MNLTVLVNNENDGLDTVERIGKYPEAPKTIWKNLNLLLTNTKYVIANQTSASPKRQLIWA